MVAAYRGWLLVGTIPMPIQTAPGRPTCRIVARLLVDALGYLNDFSETRCGLPCSQWGLSELFDPPGRVVWSVW